MILSGYLPIWGLLLMSCVSSTVKDPRCEPVREADLKQLIQELPIDSPKHVELIFRARNSHILGVAYDQYTVLWNKHPGWFDINLLRGMAAEEYGKYTVFNPSKPTSADATKAQSLFQVAQMCLDKAAGLRPKSAEARIEEGFFLWQFGNKMEEGLALLKRGVALNIKYARGHKLLSDVYRNPYGNAYDLQKSIAELYLVMKLDPSYAAPHLSLSELFASLKQFKNADKEMAAYLELCPPGMTQGPDVQRSTSMIDKRNH